MDRRRFLGAVSGLAAGPALVGGAAADHDGDEANPTPADGDEAYRPKVTTVRYPLAGVPAIETAGGRLRVELDPDALGDAAPAATLVPSFGDVTAGTELERLATRTGATSSIWNADEHEADGVTVAEFRVPGFAPREGFTPGLYDLHVSWDGGTDSQPRAVSVREEIPADPKVVIIADPQLGDPRSARTGAEESRNDGSPGPFVDHVRKGFGTPTERWGATRRAVAEVNAVDPDLVLVAGDLTFGQDAPGKYYAEYEDAWAILNRLRAPSFCTIGNHDGYVQGGVDGRELYRETFGPPSYAVEVGDDIRVAAVDTYDWSYLDRLGGSVAVSTYGGQVRDPQFEWLAGDLREWRRENPDGTVLAFGHHDPSWQPDPENRAREETDGRPVAEQVGRGSRYFESGQLWTGENQFALRELFDEVGVAAFFSGHSHRDRIARTVGGDAGVADVVETHGPRSPPAAYHYVGYERTGEPDGDGAYDEYDWTVDPADRSDGDLVDLLRDTGAGTLYVGCTTTQSSTGEYWGWRPLTVDTGTEGVDPAGFGYPVTREFLDERAVDPDAWTPAHAEVGLYSHPSYLLAAERESTDERVEMRVENGLATDVSGALLASLADCAGVGVDGGEVVWRRRGDDRQVVKVAYDAAAGSEHVVVVECRSSG